MRQTFRLFLAIGLIAFSPFGRPAANAQLLQSGPMVGHVADQKAKIWLRIKTQAVITATAWQDDRQYRPTGVEDLGGGFTVVQFSSLEPDTDTKVHLEITRAGFPKETAALSFATAPLPSPTGKVRIAFGSCSKLSQFPTGPIYRAIAEERPDMAIFVGDNSYFMVGDGTDKHFNTTGPFGDWSTIEGMIHRHLVTRDHPDLEPMLRTVPNYAVWDDHDYGPNNADVVFPLKEEALLAFRRLWANPAYGTEEFPGIYSSFRHGPVEVFLMDDRYYKYSPLEHKDVTAETGRIWGEAQLNWLLAGLEQSTAPVKVIANGTQVLTKSESGESHVREAISELNRLIEFVSERKIGGIVFLTGDRHYSEAMQWRIPDGPLMIDCTSSPLQQNQKVAPYPHATHPTRLWAMYGNNFGLLTVDIPSSGLGTIHFETRDEKNQPCVVEEQVCRTSWPLKDLNY